MVAVIAYVVGALMSVVGLLWAGLILFVPRAPVPGATGTASFELLGRLVVAWPGLATFVTGLFLLLAADGLFKLGALVRHGRKIALSTGDMARALEPPKPDKNAAGTFTEAVQLFQARTGKAEASEAIRDLASDALRQKGLLR